MYPKPIDELLVPTITNKGAMIGQFFGHREEEVEQNTRENRGAPSSYATSLAISYPGKTSLFYPTSSNHKELTGTCLRGLLGRGVIYLSTPARRRGYRAAHLQFLNKFNELKDIEHIISK